MQREKLFINSKCISTIIGRRNTWIQEYLCPFKGVKGQIYWPEELHGFYCLPRSFWGCSISKVSVLPFLRSSGGNPRVFILPEFFSILHAWSLFGCVLLTLPEMGTLQSWRWGTGDSSSGVHRYHSQVTKWGVEVEQWALEWRDQLGLQGRSFLSVPIEWTGTRLVYVDIIQPWVVFMTWSFRGHSKELMVFWEAVGQIWSHEHKKREG